VAASVERGYQQAIEQEGFRFVPLHLARRSANPWREAKSAWELFHLYRRERPDLVHHITIKPVLYGSIAALGRSDLRVINALTGLGYLVSSSSLKTRLLRWLIWNVFRFLLTRPNHSVLLQNHDDEQLLASRLGISPEKIIVIRGSGVDASLFRPTSEPQGTPTVVLASRMLWIKGVGEFVEAATVLRSKGVQGRFVLVGDTDLSNPSSIPRQQLLDWHNSGNVEWWGHQEDMPGIFQQANLVCLPSRGGEGVPKTLIEAAASGRAIVATDVPGCRDIVRQGVNGFLVPPRNANALAQAIETLIRDRELRLLMAARGRQIALDEFTQEIVVQQTLGLYRELSAPPALRAACRQSSTSNL